MDPSTITTGCDFEGYRIMRYLGVVNGITIRSRSMDGDFGTKIRQVFSADISLYTEMCERARQEALSLMTQRTAQVGANAIIGMRYDADELAQGVTEVLAYGTAVVAERV